MRKKPFRGYCQSGCGNAVFSRSSTWKYCSIACRNTDHKKPRGTCVGCHAPLPRPNQHYCSIPCQHEFQYRKKVQLLEAGNYRTTNFRSFVRTYLVERLGEQCTRCGWQERNPKTGRVPIEVEHIDGNFENNLPENLTLLCPNCHSLTETFRGLNRGRGRPYRLGGRANPLRNHSPLKDSNRIRGN